MDGRLGMVVCRVCLFVRDLCIFLAGVAVCRRMQAVSLSFWSLFHEQGVSLQLQSPQMNPAHPLFHCHTHTPSANCQPEGVVPLTGRSCVGVS